MSYKQMRDREFSSYLDEQPPTILGWNRLEGEPRSYNLERSLSFEMCDSSWMIGRQWQFGQLRGEDAASPASAKIKYSTRRIDQVRLGTGLAEPYDDSLPLEIRAEREHPPLNLRFALEAGRLWRKFLAEAKSGPLLSRDFLDDFVVAYPIATPDRDPAVNPAAAEIHGDQRLVELYALAEERAIDGAALYTATQSYLAGGPDPLHPLTPAPSLDDRDGLLRLLDFWFYAMRGRYALDNRSDGGAWRPEALGYSLSCSAPDFHGSGRIVLVAEEYRRGHLDWYSFDVGASDDAVAAQLPDAPASPPVESTVEAFVPTGARFAGMPAPRLWEFENRKTDFGKITANTTDLARLVFAEFGLAFGNDWFLLPLETEVGRILQVDGLVVTDTFGERVWVPAFGQDSSRPWERWAAYVNATAADGVPASRFLLVADAIGNMMESEALEMVDMFRDESPNMVFAVEGRITLDDGRCVDGFEAFQVRRKYLDEYRRAHPPAATTSAASTNATADAAPIAYRLMTDNIPENWIPFVPVRRANDVREIQLQRAGLLRDLGGAQPRTAPPRTQILRPAYPAAYFIHEEQVPRTGVRIVQSYQRTRHSSGRPIVWCGRAREIGHGQGSSGLAFDRIFRR